MFNCKSKLIKKGGNDIVATKKEKDLIFHKFFL